MFKKYMVPKKFLEFFPMYAIAEYDGELLRVEDILSIFGKKNSLNSIQRLDRK